MVCTETAKSLFLRMMKIVMRHFAAEANQSHNTPVVIIHRLQLLGVGWVCPRQVGFFSLVSIYKTGWSYAGIGNTFYGKTMQSSWT